MTDTPKRMKRKAKRTITARLPADLRTTIIRIAGRQGRSISFTVEALLTEAIAQRKVENESVA